MKFTKAQKIKWFDDVFTVGKDLLEIAEDTWDTDRAVKLTTRTLQERELGIKYYIPADVIRGSK